LLGLAGVVGLRQPAAPVGLDGGKAALGDAQRQWSFVLVTAPDRQRANCLDLFDQSVGQELADDPSGGAALQVGCKFNRAILAPRGRGQDLQLGFGEFVR